MMKHNEHRLLIDHFQRARCNEGPCSLERYKYRFLIALIFFLNEDQLHSSEMCNYKEVKKSNEIDRYCFSLGDVSELCVEIELCCGWEFSISNIVQIT